MKIFHFLSLIHSVKPKGVKERKHSTSRRLPYFHTPRKTLILLFLAEKMEENKRNSTFNFATAWVPENFNSLQLTQVAFLFLLCRVPNGDAFNTQKAQFPFLLPHFLENQTAKKKEKEKEKNQKQS